LKVRHEKEHETMAANSTKTKTAVPDFEAAAGRAREASDRLADVGRKVTSAYLDGVEKYFAGIAQFERKLGEQSQVEGIASLFDSHAKLTEDVAKTSISATRELITA
jgi:hypothetical protein